jgi:Flp pilus assembly protein TadG
MELRTSMCRQSSSSTDERGEVTTQVVLILPVLLLVLLVVVQIAVVSHIGHVASAAAQAGVRSAAAANSNRSESAALLAVQQTLSDLNGTLDASPKVRRTSSKVSVTVDLRIPVVVPFLPRHVSRTAIASLERFMTEDLR